MIPSPTPTPFLVEIIGGSPPTPSWLVPVIGVVGVLLGGTIALLSTRASDQRKLRRDDLRQWDKEIRDHYVEIEPVLDSVSDLRRLGSSRELIMHKVNPLVNEVIQQVDPVLRRMRLISPDPLLRAILEVEEALSSLAGSSHDGLAVKPEYVRVSHANEALRQAVIANLRISTSKRPTRPFWLGYS